jgi:hypothetical protein
MQQIELMKTRAIIQNYSLGHEKYGRYKRFLATPKAMAYVALVPPPPLAPARVGR